MDLQVRKIQFVQEFLRINNEQIINKLEETLKSVKNEFYNRSLDPYSMDELNSMIDRAEEDSKNNRTTSVIDLKNQIKTWI